MTNFNADHEQVSGHFNDAHFLDATGFNGRDEDFLLGAFDFGFVHRQGYGLRSVVRYAQVRKTLIILFNRHAVENGFLNFSLFSHPGRYFDKISSVYKAIEGVLQVFYVGDFRRA